MQQSQGAGGGAMLRDLERLFGRGTIAGLSEGQLLERFVERRDSVAFDTIVGRHGPMVLSVCRRALREPHDVEDAFQATFLVLVRRAASIRRPELLGPWLYGVAQRVANRARHDASRRPVLRTDAGRDSTDPAGGTDVAVDLVRREALEAIDEEVGRLPEKYRAPIVLCHLQGLTHDEAAARLRWPVGTVRGRLSRGRDRLRDRLTRRGLAPSGSLWGALAASQAVDAEVVVPTALAQATVKTACLIAADPSTAGVVSARAIVLTKGVLDAMLLNKLKWAVAVLAAVGFITVGTGALALHLEESADPPPPITAVDKEAPKEPATSTPGTVEADERAAMLEVERSRLELLQMELELEKQELESMLRAIHNSGVSPFMQESAETKQKFEEQYQAQQAKYLDHTLKFARARQELLHKDGDNAARERQGGRAEFRVSRRDGTGKLTPMRPPLPARESSGPASSRLERRIAEIESKLDRLLKAVEGGKDGRR